MTLGTRLALTAGLAGLTLFPGCATNEDTHSPVVNGTEVLPGKVIAYYFHRTQRCESCQAIEDYAAEVVRDEFADALKSGRLEWRPVNIEEPEHRHFEDDFKLQYQSVVLVEAAGTQVRRWKNLERIWDLLGDRLEFQAYIAAETRAFLAESKHDI